MASNYPITATGAAAAAALATALGAAITVGGIAGDPTTTRGDMSFRGDAGGGTTAQTRLAVGTTGQVLTVASGEPTWAAPAGSSPTTTRGDLIARGASADQRLAIGANGYVLTSDGTDPVWAAPSSASTTLYASDCTAENGSESASISGSGAASTLTLTASSTARVYGTSGATAARIVCALPAGTRDVEIEFLVTAVSGMNSGGYRYLSFGLRSTADGANPTSTFWGASFPDSGGSVYEGNLLSGGNAPSYSASAAHAPTSVDKWFRVTMRPRAPFIAVMTGAGTAGARPPTWVPATNGTPNPTTTQTPSVADTATMSLAIVLQSFGSGGASSITGNLTVRVGL